MNWASRRCLEVERGMLFDQSTPLEIILARCMRMWGEGFHHAMVSRRDQKCHGVECPPSSVRCTEVVFVRDHMLTKDNRHEDAVVGLQRAEGLAGTGGRACASLGDEVGWKGKIASAF